MSAKLLMGLSEENPELERQIGCMTGIFQVFDRHHLITGRRFSGQSPKRLPPGQSRSSNSTYTVECNPGSPDIVLEYKPNKSSKENRRVSVEPSASPSSYPSSSFSSTKPKSSDIEAKSTCNDFRDVVKDSINGETRILSVKTSVKEEVKDNVLKYRDSPRPIMSVDLNDSFQVLVRLKESHWNASEVSRFSCDGREMSRSKSTSKFRELPRLSLDSRERFLQTSNSDMKTKEIDRNSLNQGIPSVVAKLMGLEAIPSSASQEPVELMKPNIKKSGDSFHGDGEKDRIIHSLKSSLGASETRTLKNAGPVSKHVSKHTESVYNQIERRVKELEFPQSNKDLRALKHILDTMQAKGMLENKESKLTSEKNQYLKPADSQNPQIATPRAFKSPIVIMKPANSIKRTGDLEGLSGLRKLWTSNSASRRKVNEQTPLSEKKIEERSSQKIRIPLMQRSPRPHQPVRERSGSPVKVLSSSRPRVQQRKLEPEKKPLQPSARKQNANRKPLEPAVKPSRADIDDQQGKQADEISQRENCDISLATQPEAEVMGNDRLIIVNSPPYQDDNQKIQNEDSSSTDSAIVSVEQPSPISVLDTAFYQDDLPLSPVKKISCAIEDDEFQTSPEDCKIAMSLVNTAPSKLSSEIHIQRLFDIKNLVEKLRHLCSTDDTEDHVSEILMSAGLQEENLQPKSKTERLHQELMFDVVKEILASKLELMSYGTQPDLFLRARKLSGQYLLKELCSEIKQLLVKRPMSTSFGDEEEEDLAFREDLVRQSDGWEDFGIEVPGLVLEIERSIFKDLIDEVVTGEACSGLQTKANRRRKQLFV